MNYTAALLLVVFLFSTTHTKAATSTTSDRYRNTPEGGVLSSGPLPDLDAYTADGKAIKVRDLCTGKYTVLASGCLTCPEFHQSYPEYEAAYADYKDKGVQFFYFYKALRHPELNGYVQAQNMNERLLQLAEAKKMLGTQVPWIADTLEDSMRIGLQAGSNSLYLISPDGTILWAASKMNATGLRNALANVAGPVASPTATTDLDLPTIARNPRAVNEDSATGVARPEGLAILKIKAAQPEETYYVKLRAEADDALLTTGTGRLFLGFYPDPIHEAHWNNLAPAMKYTLTVPEGVEVSPSEATAAKGPGDSDTQPRQFWVEVKGATPGDAIQLELNYFGCAPGMCLALTHEYTIQLETDTSGSRTYGMNRGQKGANPAAQSKSNRNNRFARMDTDGNGSISLEEMCALEKSRRSNQFDQTRTERRFNMMDTNNDDGISAEELAAAPQPKGTRP